jgi:hypothetical protein
MNYLLEVFDPPAQQEAARFELAMDERVEALSRHRCNQARF